MDAPGAVDRAGVGQGADAARAGHDHASPDAEGAGIAERGQGAAGIVVGDGHQQGLAGGEAAGGQAGHGIGDHGPGVAGARPAPHQGVGRPHQVIATGVDDAQDRAAADAGRATDRQRVGAGVQRQGAARLAIRAGDADAAGQRQGGAAVHHRVAGGVDGVVQHQVAAGEDQVAADVGDAAQPRLAGQGAEGAEAAAGDGKGAAAVDDITLDQAGVGHQADGAGDVERGIAAAERAAVEQRADAAARRHVQGLGDAADGHGVGQGGQAGADIVAVEGQQQAGTADRAGAGKAGGAGGLDGGAEIAGPGGAAHQGGGVPRQVDAGAGQAGQDRAAGDAGRAADRQLGAIAHHQRAGRLAVGAGDADDAGQGQRGAAVHHRVAGDVEGVVQQQTAGREHHVAQRVAEGAQGTQGGPGQGADRAAQPPGEDQILGRQVDDVARDQATVADGSQGTGGAIEQGGAAADRAAVGKRADGAGIVDAVGGAADDALVDQGGDGAVVVHPARPGRGGVQQGAGVQHRADAAQIVKADAAGGRAAVLKLADGALVQDAVEPARQQGAVGQRADLAAAGDIDGDGYAADGAGVGQRGQGAADIVAERVQQQVDRAADGRRGAGQDQVANGGANRDAGVTGPRPALHHGAGDGVDEIGAARVQQGDHAAAADAGDAADGQETRTRRQDQAAPCLGIVAGDGDVRPQGQPGAAVDHRLAADVDLVVQRQVAAGEHQVGAGACDGAGVGQGRARQQARLAGVGAAADGQRPDAGVDDVALYRAAVDQAAQRAATGDVKGGGPAGDQMAAVVQQAQGAVDGDRPAPGDAAAVVQSPDAAAVADPAGQALDQAAVAQRGDAARVVQGGQAGGADKAGVAEDADGAVVDQAQEVARDGAQGGVGQGGDDAVVLQRRGTGQRAVVEDGADTADGRHVERNARADAARVGQGGEGAADIVADRRGQQADGAAATDRAGPQGDEAAVRLDADVVGAAVAGHQGADQGAHQIVGDAG
ncbi:Major ampullate spidroin 1 [Nitrospirillum viridazoti Y2]|nr:Major ampullate spidroin 1 [Nitrospirillum amazonense Y2]